MDKKRKAIIKIFKGIDFGIDSQANRKNVDVFDVTLNLQNGTYRPYKKPSNSYRIPSLKDCRKVLLTQKFLIHPKFKTKMRRRNPVIILI